MPQIVFSILATAQQRDEIIADMRRLLALNAGTLAADLTVDVSATADPSLQEVWDDHGFGEQVEGAAEQAAVVLDVTSHTGSISAATMRLAEVLTVRDEQPAEQLFQQVADDPGEPRVPWHVQVRP